MELAVVSLQDILEGHKSVNGGAIYREAAHSGASVEDTDLALINKWTRGPVTRQQVYTFPALAIDEQATRNYVRYTAQSQKASYKAWVGIPFLYNEDSQWASLFDGSDHSLKASSEVARIYKSELVRTPDGFIGTLTHQYSIRGVDHKIDSFINRVEAGLLREVSIHVSVPNGAQCQLCKQMYPCGKHELAQVYDGKTCTVDTVGAFVPLELSAVACPGSVVAHIMPDEETASYKVLSLSEALGGSRQLIEGKIVEHKVESCEDAKCAEEACKERIAKLNETAPVAHVAEGCTATDCAEDVCVEARKKKADPDGDGDGPESKETAKPIHLFTENCPACGGGNKEAALPQTLEEALVPVRADFQERLSQVVAKAQEKVSEAVAIADAAKEKAEAYDAMFAEFVQDTVELAVARGKENSEVDAYREELTKSGVAGVKLVREALKSAPASNRETARERLQSTAKERADNALGTTLVKVENGKIAEYKKPRLG